MVSMSTLTAAGFKRLEDIENYMDWSIQVKTKLTDRQLWDIVEGTNEILEAETDEAASKAWFEKNAMALGVIRYSCGGRLCWVIEMITSAKIAWHTLAAICKLPISSYKDVFKNLEDADNYLDWSLQVKTKLANQLLWDIVEGNDEAPKAENDEAAFKAWSEKNAMALGVIRYFGEGPLKWVIWRITSAKIAWETLATICTLPKSSFIVPEEYDYVAWSVRMKAYLKACELWDIVEAATQPPKPEDDEIAFNAWSKKDAIAFYLIRESSSAFYSSLFPGGTAQNAWDILAKFYNSEGRENSELRKYVLLKQYIRDGNWAAANQFITSNPGAESAIISNTRSTALHIAIIAGHLHIVKELVNMLPTDKLRMTDKDGNTVLGCCALVGNTQMAKCIVEKCPMLLSIGNKFDKLIPVVMALTCNSNSIATARYLYSVTPPGSLSPGKGSVNGATFVTRCIYSKNFDMALDVLEKFPTLVTALDIEEESPVLALASMSFPYTSENQLISWKQWIYNCKRIPGVDDINQIPVSIQKTRKGKKYSSKKYRIRNQTNI
nr:uncharacterized protein LOC111988362 [Quercus suber]